MVPVHGPLVQVGDTSNRLTRFSLRTNKQTLILIGQSAKNKAIPNSVTSHFKWPLSKYGFCPWHFLTPCDPRPFSPGRQVVINRFENHVVEIGIHSFSTSSETEGNRARHAVELARRSLAARHIYHHPVTSPRGTSCVSSHSRRGRGRSCQLLVLSCPFENPDT